MKIFHFKQSPKFFQNKYHWESSRKQIMAKLSLMCFKNLHFVTWPALISLQNCLLSSLHDSQTSKAPFSAVHLPTGQTVLNKSMAEPKTSYMAGGGRWCCQRPYTKMTVFVQPNLWGHRSPQRGEVQSTWTWPKTGWGVGGARASCATAT